MSDHPPIEDNQDRDPLDGSALDKALDRGFAAKRKAGAPVHGDSVLDRIGEVTGNRPRIALRDATEQSHTPMLKPLGPEDEKDTGKYVIQGELGRGGVGAVHKGHDQDLGRDVAMKFLHDKYKDEPSILHRFVEEAQIGGQLQHPGIVPVYDLGMSNGKPFFAMKLVKGETLAKKLLDRDDSWDSRRQLIAVFEDICQTMAYAHARGVVHRDLKPANVMIGSFGEVQVVDWGMGKVLQQGGVADEKRAAEKQDLASVIETVRSDGHGTQSVMGSVMGTPAYMPPEQARGDIDAMDERSDVFALGAILCEILTGAPPYSGSQEDLIVQAAMARQADAHDRLANCDAEPELVDLAKQCLMPAPAARPRTAQQVAEVVHGYLAALEERVHDARVEAAEAEVRTAALRRIQRLAVALVVVFATGLAASLWFWHQSGLETQRAESELARAVATKQLLIDMLEGITPEQARDADTTLLRQILDNATRRIDDATIPDKLVAAELQSVIATIYRLIGEHDLALRHATAASDSLSRLIGPDDIRSIEALASLAIVHKNLSDYVRAETTCREVLRRLGKSKQPDDPGLLIQRVNLAVFLAGQERFAEAQREYEECIAIQRRVLADNDAELYRTIGNLAELQSRRGLYEKAETLLRQALEGQRRILGDDHPTVVLTTSSLARACTNNHKYEEAERLYETILESQTRVLSADHPRLLMTQSNLANLLGKTRRYAQAEALHREVYEAAKRTLGPGAAETLGALNNLASAVLHQGRHEEAEPLFREALRLTEKRDGKDATSTLRVLENLANVFLRKGDPNAAIDLLEDAVQRSTSRWGEKDPTTLRARARLAFALASATRFGNAGELLEKLIPDQKAVLGEQSNEALDAMLTLARVYKAKNQNDKSTKLFKDLLARHEEKHGVDHVDYARVAMELGQAYIDQRQLAAGTDLLRSGIKTYRARVGESDRELAVAQSKLGLGCMMMNDWESAIEALRAALPVIQKIDGNRSNIATGIANNLASAYMQVGRLEDAEPLFLEQIELMKSTGGPASAAGAQTNLGNVYLRMERFADAARMFETSLPIKRRFFGKRHPWTGFAIHGLALAYHGLGREEDAVPLFREHLELQTSAADRSNAPIEAIGATALLLLTHPIAELREPQLALELATTACEQGAEDQRPELHLWLDTLAQAQFGTGDPDNALVTIRRAIETSPPNLPDEQKQALQRRLEEYESAAKKD